VQNHLDVPKITKIDAFSLFQSETSIFHDERASSTSFPVTKKARTVLLQSPKSTILPSKSKKRRDKHTANQNKERPTHSKFKFQIQIAQKTHEVVSGAKKIAPRQFLAFWETQI
jgi:hypothetical protein